VEATADDRAAVAVQALRGAVLRMPPARALDVLRTIDPSRVSVAKEVSRLLGELPGGAGHDELLAMAAGPLHRDVRAAVLRALWGHLERPATWPVLRAAAADPDPAVARAVVRIPADGASAGARRSLVELLAVLLAHPSERIRLEALHRVRWLPVADPDRLLGPPVLDALASSLLDEVEAAVDALLGAYGRGDDGWPGAAAQRVLTDRRALAAFVGRLLAHTAWTPAPYAATTRAVLDLLDTDPMTAELRPRLALAGLDAAEAATRLRAQAAAGALHAGALAEAVEAVPTVHHGDGRFAPELERLLAEDPDERLRRIALAALVADAIGRTGWDDEHRGRLATYRRDPSPLVAGAAQFTFPSDDGGLDDRR
jgi:hypothetical protein